MEDKELELLEYLNDDEKSSEPLPKWAKSAIEERIMEMKYALEHKE